MTAGATDARIREFILGKFPLAKKRGVRDDDPLLRTGILDSLGILEVVSFLESEFQIVVADEELVPESFETIATIARFVDGKRASGAATG
ncbi:MAG TPA: acyl carrier protein [Candidatus Eisenbacteria bacterium]|nr:acyl carrier protein [Candidatus Eisenbacteria bacterium]